MTIAVQCPCNPFPKQTLDVRQSIDAINYRNTTLAAWITCVTEALGKRPFEV